MSNSYLVADYRVYARTMQDSHGFINEVRDRLQATGRLVDSKYDHYFLAVAPDQQVKAIDRGLFLDVENRDLLVYRSLFHLSVRSDEVPEDVVRQLQKDFIGDHSFTEIREVKLWSSDGTIH